MCLSCAAVAPAGQYTPIVESAARPGSEATLQVRAWGVPKGAVHIGNIEVRGLPELPAMLEEAKRLASRAGADLLIIDRVDARPQYRKDAVLTENGDVKTTYKKGWQGRLQARAFRARSPGR